MSVRQGVLYAIGGGTLSLPGVFTGTPAADIPPRAALAYLEAAAGAPCDMDWRDLAGVGYVETRHGTLQGSSIGPDGGLTLPIVSSAGAEGVMQFMPKTGAVYVKDADADGVANVNDIDDSAPATAAKLCADGYMTDRLGALGGYNGGPNWRNYAESQDYVKHVDAYAASLPEYDPQSPGGGNAPNADRSLTVFVNRLWGGIVGGWVALGSRLVGSPKQAWQRVDTMAFGPTGPVLMAKTPGSFEASWHGPGLQPEFARRFEAMAAAAPGSITISSGYRDAVAQKAIWDKSDKTGKMVAFSDGVNCSSNHCQGLAGDLTFASTAVQTWAHEHAGEFGLRFPMDYEPWHVEPKGIR